MATAVQVGQPKRATIAARKRKRFLELVRDGQSIKKAAAAANIPRNTVYRWRQEDPDFAHEWDEAWEQGADHLEDIALSRAEDGSELMTIFLLKGRRPGRYRDNVKHEVDARISVTVDDARLELAKRFGMIEDHRARAIEGTSRELPAGPTS